MKKLTNELALKISDWEIEQRHASAGNVLSQFSIEKDYLIFSTIKLINELPKNPFFTPVFCGGTCLSKAHGILDRMSEDVDFKIVPNEAGLSLSAAQRRKELSNFTKSIVSELENSGFDAGNVERRSRDENKYTALFVNYESVLPRPSSLKPHILLELNYTSLTNGTSMQSIGNLLDKLITGNYIEPFEIECVTLPEAFVEKLISFPRRLAMQLAKLEPGQSLDDVERWDKALVRHVYDVFQVVDKVPGILGNADELVRMMQCVIAKDMADFKNQHPEFVESPLATLTSALQWAKDSEVLLGQYNKFTRDMVYGPLDKIPSFKDALANFDLCLGVALGRPLCVCTGSFSGVVLGVQDGVVTQKTNRDGSSSLHSLFSLSFPVVVGDMVDIAYADGVGIVSGQGVSVGVGR